MSYLRTEQLYIYQRFVDLIPTDGGEKEIYDYCVVLWEKRCKFYAKYAFEMIELLQMIEREYGYPIPSFVFDALERDCKEGGEREDAVDTNPSIYGKTNE
jgi:hypothetical protein